MANLKTLTTILATAALATGCATAPRFAYSEDAAPTASTVNLPAQEKWQHLNFDCKAPRDKIIEDLMNQADLFPDFEGQKTYCAAKIPTAMLPAMGMENLLVIETGEQPPANCGDAGCNVMFIAERKSKLTDVSVTNIAVLLADPQKVSYSSSGGVIGVTFKTPYACNGIQPCITRKDAKTGQDVNFTGSKAIYAYDPVKKHFYEFVPK